MKTSNILSLILLAVLFYACGDNDDDALVFNYSNVEFEDARFYTYQGSQITNPLQVNENEENAFKLEIQDNVDYWKDTLAGDLFIEKFTLLDDSNAQVKFQNNIVNASYIDSDGILVLNGDVKSRISINEERTVMKWSLITMVQGNTYLPFDSNVIGEELDDYPAKQDLQSDPNLMVGDTVKVTLLNLVYNLE